MAAAFSSSLSSFMTSGRFRVITASGFSVKSSLPLSSSPVTYSAMAGALARLLRPLLRRIFPKSFADEDCAAAISQNFTANLLGLGNAATPAGLKAAARMHALSPEKNLASGEMCRLVVLNSASVQLIPTTVAALRSAAGAADAFDILPCVWLTSIVSVAVGLTSARLMEAWGK